MAERKVYIANCKIIHNGETTEVGGEIKLTDPQAAVLDVTDKSMIPVPLRSIKDVIAAIKAAKTAEAVYALLRNETRKAVHEAVTGKLEELRKGPAKTGGSGGSG